MKAIAKEPEVQSALFDYGELDRRSRDAIKERAEQIRFLLKRATQDVVDIGQKLADVKDRLKSSDKFAEWVAAEFGQMSERTAYNFIAVYQRFSGADFNRANIAVSALYLLAAPSTPPEAIEQAKQMADSGEEVTHKVAKEIVHQAKENEKRRQPQLVPEPEPGETPDMFPVPPRARLVKSPENLPIPTARSAAEINRMANLRWSDSDNTPVEICHLEGPGGRQQAFVVTDWETDGDGRFLAVDAWPLTPIQDYKVAAPISYQDFLDSERPADDLSGIKVNCGSKTKPVWYVITGSKLTFTKEQTCRKCGCTDNDCRQCIAKTGEPCHWVAPGLCSACANQPAPAAPGKRPTTDQMKAQSALDRRWRGLNVRISLTLMQAPLNRPEPRVIMGSINADRHQSLPFNFREDDPDQIGAALARHIKQFYAELDKREVKTTAKPAPAKAPPRSSPKPAPKSNSKKPAGVATVNKNKSTKPMKKGRR